MEKLLNKTIVFFSLVIVYRLLLDYIYIHYTYTFWYYTGFVNNETVSSHVISWIILFVITLQVSPYIKSRGLFYPDLLILFFLMRVVPFTSLMRFVNTPNSLSFLYFVYFSLIFTITRFLKLRPVPLNFSGITRQNDTILYVILFFFAAVIVFISGYYAHFRIQISFNDVYEMREEAKNFELPTIMRYAWSPATNVLPLLFAYYLKKKKPLISIFILFLILLNFSINGMKSTFFKLLICLLFALINFKDLKKYYLPGFVGLMVITIIEGKVWDFHFLHDIVIRRVLYIPSLLDTCYYDYITQNGPLYYLRGGDRIQNIISEVYFGDPEMVSNNGLFSDAYMNLGMIGCFVYPIIYAFMFRICGSAFRGADKGLIIFAAIIMSYTLEGSELTTGLLTHGLLIFCIILYMVSIRSFKSNKSNNNRVLESSIENT